MQERSTERLAALVRERGRRQEVNMQPSSAYEAVTRQMVEAVAEDVRDLRSRIDWLIFVVLSAIIVDVVLRFAGV